MLTTVLASLSLVAFAVLQRVLRRGEQARSVQPTGTDHGSTKLLGAAFLFGILALLASPVLNAQGIGALGSGAVVGWIGIAVMVSGLTLRVWSQAALGQYYTTTLRHSEDQVLIASGPYRFVRHPGYGGLLLAWAGAGMATGNWAVASATVLLMVVAYCYRIAREEAMLLNAFGDRYMEYVARTWRLIPYVY